MESILAHPFFTKNRKPCEARIEGPKMCSTPTQKHVLLTPTIDDTAFNYLCPLHYRMYMEKDPNFLGFFDN
jgi:hypothetical protein